MKRAGYEGRAAAAERGLLHSSLAKEAEQAAVLDRSVDIARSDEAARLQQAQLDETTRASMERERIANLSHQLATYQFDEAKRSNLVQESLAQQNLELNEQLGLGRLGLDQKQLEVAQQELQHRITQAATEEERLRTQQELQNTTAYHQGMSQAQNAYTNGIYAVMSNENLSANERKSQIKSLTDLYRETIAELKESYAAGLYS